MKEGILSQKDGEWFVDYQSKNIPIKDINDAKLFEGKSVRFDMVDVYVEPPGDIHPNRGGYKKMASLIPQIEQIKIGEGCFGSYVQIDGQDLNEHEYVTEEESKKISDSKLKLFEELRILLNKLDMYDLRLISEVIVKRGSWDTDDNKSYTNSCDQCGNYNWGETYNRI